MAWLPGANFVPAGMASTPDFGKAAFYDQIAEESARARQERQMAAPIELYKGYADITETNPIADWMARGKTAPGFASGAVPTASASPLPMGGSVPVGPMSQTPTSQAAIPAALRAGPVGPQSIPGGSPAPGGATAGATMGKFLPAGIGGLVGAGLSAATGGKPEDVIRSGVGGAAGGALMSSAPVLAAAGPAGWAGIAGLAALQLYGLLG